MPISVAPDVAARATPYLGTLWAAPLAGLAGDPNQIEAADFAVVDAAAPPHSYDLFSRLIDANGKRTNGVILLDLTRHTRIATSLMREGANLETHAAVTHALTHRLSAFMSDSSAVASALHGPAQARSDFERALFRYSEAFGTLSSRSALRVDAAGEALSEWNKMQQWLGDAMGHSRVRLQTTLSGERAHVTAINHPG